MFLSEDFKDLLRTFNKHNVRYILVGGYAYALHVQPRATKDIDLWVATDPENAQAVFNALKEFGAPLESLVPNDFTKKGDFFYFGIPPWRVDILTSIDGVEFEDAWSKKLSEKIDDIDIFILSLDDIILKKETSGRPRDLLDVEDLKQARTLLADQDKDNGSQDD